MNQPAAESKTEATGRHMILNMGPQHPSTHGVLRLVLELDGETICRAEPDIGYLHTGIEKQCESLLYQQVVPLTDRVDYLANLSNNLCYALAVVTCPRAVRATSTRGTRCGWKRCGRARGLSGRPWTVCRTEHGAPMSPEWFCRIGKR